VGVSTGLVVLGCLEETVHTVQHLDRLGVRPDHVLSLAGGGVDREAVAGYADLRPLARELAIPYSEVSTYAMTDAADAALVADLAPEILLVIGWQRLVPAGVLDTVSVATIGFHGSANVLPWGRGRSPINWSIIEGRDRFALHMFLITPGVDDGDVVGVRLYDINAWDDCRTVYYKTAIVAAELIAAHLPAVRAGEPGLRQRGEAFAYPKRTPADGRIDWTQSSEAICRLVRATTRPYPGAFATLGDEAVRIWRAQPFSRDLFADAAAGEVCFVSAGPPPELVVRSGDGTVLIRDLETTARLQVGARLR
jgi:methionyl-tRNA formyltransferase